MSFSSSNPSTLPSVGPPLSGWRTASTHRSGVRDRRQQKLGLWSAVALQQHFTTTGGRRGRPLPSTESHASTPEGLAERAGTSTTTTTAAFASCGGAGTANGDGDLRAHLGPAGSLAANPHKPTLAQRMGLVPPPPPAPSADDWRVVVHRAMQREHYASRETPAAAAALGPSSSSAVCSICQMSFLSTSNEGQVILSCSHVFHAQCFRAFEQCVRAQQRADGAAVAEVTTQLACPVCRTQHYYKRVFYEGKAMTQRAAVVKVQSAIRGFLARRGYVKIRLQRNVHFRTRYVQERLARLSAAWSAFCAQQAQHRETTLVALAVQHQAATAAYLSEEQWATIWEDAVRKAVEPGTSKDAEDGATGGSGSDSRGVVVVMQCPICLERICDTFFSQRQREGEAGDAAATGDDAVASLRRAYEQRRAAKESAAATGPTHTSRGTGGDAKSKKSAQRSKAASTIAPVTTSSSVISKQSTKATPGEKTSADEKVMAASTVQLPPLSTSPPLSSLPGPAALFCGPQSGVLLSCGHCFHAACLGCYERFNEQRMTEAAASNHSAGSGVVIADRCPICRAGYAKHPL